MTMPETLLIITDNWLAFLHGISVTVTTTVSTILTGSLLGIVVAVGSLYVKNVQPIFRAYVEALLGLPVLVLLVWLYYVLPTINPVLTFSPYSVGILGLSLSLSAFVAEIVEGGIRSVPKGQVETAYLLGVGRMQTVRYIVLPQAIRTMWPALVVQYITTYKFSTLVSVIGVQDILHVGSQVVAQTYRILEVYTFIASFFIVTIVPLNMLARLLSKTRGDIIGQLSVLIRLQNVDKCFAGKPVLRNFDLSIRMGENILIQGSSGSGKTTILRVISLLESVDRGSIWYNDMDVTAYAGHYPPG